MFTSLFRFLQRFDWVLMLAAFVLFSFGIAAITSVELSRQTGEFVFIRKQLLAFGLGLVAFLVAAGVNYQFFRGYARLLYAGTVALLIAVLFFGETFNGTTGWFVVAGFAFQPVELMKFALAVELARYFSDDARARFGWRELAESGLRVVLPVVLIMLQPDLGGSLILIGIWAISIFFAGIGWRHTLAMASVAVLVIGIGYSLFTYTNLVEQYQRERIATFLNPSADPLDTGYNINQAKIAIGAGGFLGRGLGGGSQSQLRFLPESQTDFVFAVIAEELGFLGVSVLLGAFVLLLTRILLMARVARDPFAAYLAVAICAYFFMQAFIHVGVNLAVMPATGITLPLVSYGGTSLILTLLMLGAVQSVARQLTAVDRIAGKTTTYYT